MIVYRKINRQNDETYVANNYRTTSSTLQLGVQRKEHIVERLVLSAGLHLQTHLTCTFKTDGHFVDRGRKEKELVPVLNRLKILYILKLVQIPRKNHRSLDIFANLYMNVWLLNDVYHRWQKEDTILYAQLIICTKQSISSHFQLYSA